MPVTGSKVLPNKRPSAEEFSEALAADWLRCFPNSARRDAAARMDCDPKTITNAIGGEHAPKAFTLLASLLADPTALQRTLALFGVKAVPLELDAANDLSTVAGLSHFVGSWASALADGTRDHRETCELADEVRQIIPALTALVADADRLRA